MCFSFNFLSLKYTRIGNQTLIVRYKNLIYLLNHILFLIFLIHKLLSLFYKRNYLILFYQQHIKTRLIKLDLNLNNTIFLILFSFIIAIITGS